MTILAYRLTRFGRTEEAHLCTIHVDARHELGWKVSRGRKPRWEDARCIDCGAAKNTVLAAVVSADAPVEPEPIAVLPGQRKLFA